MTTEVTQVQSVLAFDRASVRTFDQDGLLHVSMTPISKANVCTYYGREIPDSESLGLAADKAYRMLRCPEELKKAAPTFNKKPVLNTHLPVFASAPPKEAIIGSTGEGANFDGVMLNNSMVVWDDKSIAGIESNQQREISSSYRYRADMTPGVYNGEEYDGVMRDIVCNHVAIVPDGRAGPDVLVYDSKPEGYGIMSKFNKLWALVKPRLAADANPDEVEKEVKKIVEDEDKDDDKDKDDKKDKMADDSDKDETEEERMARMAKERDDRIKESEEKERRMASDSKAIEQRLRDQMQSEFRALRQAERDCAPFVGSMACDSAEELYRATLNHAGVKGVESLPASALKPMVDMLKTSRTMANDSAPVITADSASRVNAFFEGK